MALGSEKRYLALHLMRLYADEALCERLRDAFRVAGMRLDKGKACVRFRTADDLPLDVIGESVASTPVDRWIETASAAPAAMSTVRVYNADGGVPMADAATVANQRQILANQRRILANQTRIESNQRKLDALLTNQKKLDRILANQKRILARLR